VTHSPTALGTVFGFSCSVIGIISRFASGASIKGSFASILTQIGDFTALGGAVIVIMPLLALGLLTLLAVATYILDFIVSRPLAVLVSSAANESLVRLVGLALLVVGIHFELLAST
jgi:hypothetical protein